MGQVLDFAQFLKYKTIEVPVKYGSKSGKIYTFSHQNHLKNGLLKNYKDGLKEIIERKKYLDSEKYCCDIGPTVAVANLIEDGEYAEFVKQFNHDDFQLKGLEHVLRVEEIFNGKDVSHTIMPLYEDHDFANEEQQALMRYSTYFKRLTDPTKDLNQGAAEWVIDNKHAEVFREEILKASRVYDIGGYSRIYYNCAIYKNLFSEIIKKFSIDERTVEDTQRIKIASEVFHDLVA